MSTLPSAPPIPLKPPLKWAGGKRWLVPHLEALVTTIPAPVDRTPRLVEPFVGGMAIALGLQPARALLNDLNPHLISFYRWLQRGLAQPIPMANDQAQYYQHRQRFNDLIAQGQAETAEAAWLFYYLNRTGFNGLCRFNQRGLFNVPFGRYKRIHYQQDFWAYQSLLAPWTLQHGDFGNLTIQPGDWIYADPPYDVPFTSYSAGGFDWPAQVRLAQWLREQTVPVIASNQATERILALYQELGFRVTVIEAPRRIACNGDRQPAAEMLATHNL